MSRDIFLEIHQGLPGKGSGRLEYTRRAFQMLPALDRSRILDVGCGRGEPTLELARLSQAQVVGVDTDKPSLDMLAKKVEEAGLSERVQAVECSMFAMAFPDESFDIIWAEGSIFIIGFERGLVKWHRLIKPSGYLVVHEMVWLRSNPPPEIYNYWKARYSGIRTAPENLKQIPTCGYCPVGHFTLPEDAWWTEYYGPLETRVQELREKYITDSSALAVLDREQREIDTFKKCRKWYGSAFFVMQKGIGSPSASSLSIERPKPGPSSRARDGSVKSSARTASRSIPSPSSAAARSNGAPIAPHHSR